MNEDTPTPAEQPRRMRGWRIELPTGASVALYPEALPDGNGLMFVNKEGVRTALLLSDSACDALAELLKRREHMRAEQAIWSCTVGEDGRRTGEWKPA